MTLKPVYAFFGGFAETITVVSLASAIVLAFLSRLTGSYAAALTALGGWGVIHDQLTQFQDHRDKDAGYLPTGKP